MQHDLLREIAIHQAREEPYEQRKRLIFEINENNWPLQNQQEAVACTLSISTDEMGTPDWCSMLPAEVFEVLVLNLRTKEYTLPEFMEKMSKLKVLIITNYDDFSFSELYNFEILSSVSTLKRIRLQEVSVPLLGNLNNLRKLSLYMCDTRQLFQNDTIPISDALPNLEELSIDYSIDLVELPAELCKITTLKKLSITKCGKFSILPREIGNLVNLEMLRLSSCSVLGELPSSIGMLDKLGYLDISYCYSLPSLPEEIGELGNLRKLHMTGCTWCKLPMSVIKLEHLRSLICDEETAAFWEDFKLSLPNLEIKESGIDVPMFT
ncbi:unnamed protein product [Lupinus luteus]|uniref:Disease resistance protein n=1 Tax=Lupinus luteus TaxID=3873 RepID=A0AAV1WWW0_LUPLU